MKRIQFLGLSLVIVVVLSSLFSGCSDLEDEIKEIEQSLEEEPTQELDNQYAYILQYDYNITSFFDIDVSSNTDTNNDGIADAASYYIDNSYSSVSEHTVYLKEYAESLSQFLENENDLTKLVEIDYKLQELELCLFDVEDDTNIVNNDLAEVKVHTIDNYEKFKKYFELKSAVRIESDDYPLECSLTIQNSEIVARKKVARSTDSCSLEQKTVIVFSNGMMNDKVDAISSRMDLEIKFKQVWDKLPEDDALKQTEIFPKFKLFYNENENLFVQLPEVMAHWKAQNNVSLTGITKKALKGFYVLPLLNDDSLSLSSPVLMSMLMDKILEISAASVYEDDLDLQTHVNDYNENLDNGKKIIVVSHSQGNFYVNLAWSKMIEDNGDKYNNSFANIGVATPANSIANQGTYFKFHSDFIVTTIGSLYANKTKINATTLPSLNDHAFLSYLNDPYIGDEMIEDIFRYMRSLHSPLIPEESNIYNIKSSTDEKGQITLKWDFKETSVNEDAFRAFKIYESLSKDDEYTLSTTNYIDEYNDNSSVLYKKDNKKYYYKMQECNIYGCATCSASVMGQAPIECAYGEEVSLDDNGIEYCNACGDNQAFIYGECVEYTDEEEVTCESGYEKDESGKCVDTKSDSIWMENTSYTVDGTYYNTGSEKTWHEANNICTLIGGRLPTMTELQIEFDNCVQDEDEKEMKAFDPNICSPDGFGQYYYWSDKVSVEYDDYAYIANFSGEEIEMLKKMSYPHYYRCAKK